ncbi:ABC transporter ATP-binding protein [Actinomadura harenae]|uniref:ABC transporter ATP-binding protein n=1 Tax=Actinomadura harenae TaxID=2483351 RepID=A0A3M2M7F6_9ACTN|nr:ABC transporter ATP-binding protein [Actinomadura harenae]RMI45462.1 ABC transporter ATP-binding protein [Actinomadura harenae]
MTVLSIEDLRLELPGASRPVLAGVDLEVRQGQTVALVGESGSGKSLTSRSVLRLLPPGARAGGAVRVAGEDVLAMPPARLRELRSRQVSMVFQDPRAAINPMLRVGAFLTESLRANLGESKAGARARAVEMLEAVGLTDRVLRQHPHQLSGGMLQRVMIAAALLAGPALLLADEPTTALDVSTQAEIVALLADLRERFGTGLLFVTHDLGLAAAIADHVYVMYAGRIVEHGTAETVFAAPRHPYTSALLEATPSLAQPDRRLHAIPGRPPDLRAELTGCAFAPRCTRATDECHTTVPVGQVACHHPGGTHA